MEKKMNLNWKIITAFLTAILLTIAIPTFSLTKTPIFQNESEHFQLPDIVIAQKNRDNPKIPWYNCSTRESWSPAKKEWCRKVEKLKNMTYIFPDRAEYDPETSSATLKNGIYRRGNQGGTTFSVEYLDSVIFADLNKNGIEEAIVLLGLSGGGSGYWIYLAVVNQLNSNPKNIDSVDLGDRIEIKSLKVIDGKIQVNLITHRENDPRCCPTLPVTWTYQLQGNKLVKITSASPSKPNQNSSINQGYCTFLPTAGFGAKIVNDRCQIKKINNNAYQLIWSNGRAMSITLNPASIDGKRGQLIQKAATSATVKTNAGRVGFCWNCNP